MKEIEKIATRVPFGAVWFGFLTFFYMQYKFFFPNATIEVWQVLTSYMILVLAFSIVDLTLNLKTNEKNFKISFLKIGIRFIIFLVVSMVFFGLIALITDEALNDVRTAISVMGIGVILFQGIVVGITEEYVFRGVVVKLFRRIGLSKISVWLLQTFIFGLYHWGISGSFIVGMIYTAHGIVFMSIQEIFSPETREANSGAHVGWNYICEGVLEQ